MRTVFGVYSATPMHKKFKNGYTMYDWVKRQKDTPEFCIRTLCGKNKITAEEIEFLRDKNCKIGLAFCDRTDMDFADSDGVKDATWVLSALKEWGVPKNEGILVFVKLDTEYTANYRWMTLFASVLNYSGYIAAFIGPRDLYENVFLDNQIKYYYLSKKKEPEFPSALVSTDSKLSDETKQRLSNSQFVTGNIGLDSWMCGTITFDGIQVDNIYSNNEIILQKMW